MTKLNETVSVLINGTPVTVNKNMTVLQACQQIDVEVPVFCYHPKLTVAGNCRMCLVQIGSSPKPAASCAMPVAEGMEIFTNTELVKTARKGVLEFLLINHPLDCPICDQGGECDLQDITLAYGCGKSRYNEAKRAVPNPDFGPLIKTMMNRCIHCMRCVRFGKEIAGVPELGGLDRGEETAILTVVGSTVTNELSGNMIDICPVGALTAKPYAFEGRPWEFKHTESLDIHDAVGSNIRIDTRGESVMRILPRPNDEINEDWISDKVRFSYDALRRQRLDRPYIRQKDKLEEASLQDATSQIIRLLKTTPPERIGIFAGPLTDVETLYAFKTLAEKFSIKQLDCSVNTGFCPAINPADYVFNTPIAAIEEADVCLLIGTNPRFEAPMINTRLRKAFLHNALTVALIGEESDLTYAYDHLGTDFSVLNEFDQFDHPFVKTLTQAKKPMLILGSGIESHPEAEKIYAQARHLAAKFNMIRSDWMGFNYLSLDASRVGSLDLGFYQAQERKTVNLLKDKKLDVLFSLGVETLPEELTQETTVVYLGHHGEQGAQQADFILPTPAFHEKDSIYVNVEGRPQFAYKALRPVGAAIPEWIWVRDVLKSLGGAPYQTLNELRQQLFTQYPSTNPESFTFRRVSKKVDYQVGAILKDTEVSLPIANFYMTNVITRVSETMAKCLQYLSQQDVER